MQTRSARRAVWCGVIALGAALAPVRAGTNVSLLVTLRGAAGADHASALSVEADAANLLLPGEGSVATLELTASPGARTEAWLGRATPLPLQPLHFYRVRARMRRTARTEWRVAFHENGREDVAQCPHWDYLVAPVWEDVVSFYIAPATSSVVCLRLTLQNPADGLPDASAGLADLRIEDAGALVPLKPPRRVTTCDRFEPARALGQLPLVVSQGAGLYRVTARVTAAAETVLWMSLLQGDDPRLWWHRSSEIVVREPVPAGTSEIQWHYRVPDRRFVHQYVRYCTQDGAETVVVEDLILEQIAAEPPAASAMGLQTPKYR